MEESCGGGFLRWSERAFEWALERGSRGHGDVGWAACSSCFGLRALRAVGPDLLCTHQGPHGRWSL